ncbi:MAG: hypothetical protein U0164_00195 [Gemmatimonadaceae bacterium]
MRAAAPRAGADAAIVDAPGASTLSSPSPVSRPLAASPHNPLALPKRRPHRLRNPPALFSGRREAIDDHHQLTDLREVDLLRREVVDVQRAPVGDDAQEALGAQVLDHHGVRDLARQAQREADQHPRPVRQREEAVGHRIDRVRRHLAPAERTERASHARPEQAQVVVDLRRRPHGRARRLGGVLLLDRDRGRDAVDAVDVGLLHALEELPRVRRQRFDVAPLPLGVDGVEGERRLAGAGGAGDDGDRAARDGHVDPFQVVLPGAPDENRVLHGRKS